MSVFTANLLPELRRACSGLQKITVERLIMKRIFQTRLVRFVAALLARRGLASALRIQQFVKRRAKPQ